MNSFQPDADKPIPVVTERHRAGPRQWYCDLCWAYALDGRCIHTDGRPERKVESKPRRGGLSR